MLADNPDHIARELVNASSRGVALRGLGRSYGDAAQRSNGTTLRFTDPVGVKWVDRSAHLAKVSASATIADLIEFGETSGHFVPVTPGTKWVTVGGAIAADIHGKDHHAAGSFGHHVERLTIMLPDGSCRTISRDQDHALFAATLGGMGLTGAILDADIRLLPVGGNRILVDTFRTPDLESTMAAMTDAEPRHRYSVAWIDLMATGAHMGRGVVTNGDHTSDRHEGPPLRGSMVGIPSWWNIGVVSGPGVKAFNELWFRKAPLHPTQTMESYDRFFYPLDMVGDWNRLYGRRGFLQYQFVLPFQSENRIPMMVRELSRSGVPIFLAVLKRFGREGDGFLSFPRPGWTLAMDIPIPRDPRPTERLLARLDRQVLDGDGRIYLAKDSRLASDHLAAMYPDLERFRTTRAMVDPYKRLCTDLSARLGL